MSGEKQSGSFDASVKPIRMANGQRPSIVAKIDPVEAGEVVTFKLQNGITYHGTVESCEPKGKTQVVLTFDENGIAPV